MAVTSLPLSAEHCFLNLPVYTSHISYMHQLFGNERMHWGFKEKEIEMMRDNKVFFNCMYT